MTTPHVPRTPGELTHARDVTLPQVERVVAWLYGDDPPEKVREALETARRRVGG